ncbi:hypothetical protein PRZ48_010302 [Zasmidium cellare]|uniref:Uncharacterized protein n=1 Tax=Zasmidium cellare TaxID=395010 RepID=A0ABR0E8A2_ZASCE|nr:hypothetical protein PRZ48_010302 [Zasmidium cellare]
MSSNSSVAGDTAEITTPSTPSNFSSQANGNITTPSAPTAASKKRKRSEDDEATEDAEQDAGNIPQTAAQPAQSAAPPPQPTTQPPQPTTQPTQPANQAPPANAPQPTFVDLTSDGEQPKKRRKLVPPFIKCEVTLKWYEEDHTQKQDDALVILSTDRKTLDFWQLEETPYLTIPTAAIKNVEHATNKELILTREGQKTLVLDLGYHFRNDKHSRVPAQFLTALAPLGNNGQGTDDLQKQRADNAAREKFVHDAVFIRNQWQTYDMNDWEDTTKNKLKAFCRDVDEKDPSRPLRGTSNLTKPLIQLRIIQWLKANPDVGLPAGATSTAGPQYEAVDEDKNVISLHWTKDEARKASQDHVFREQAAERQGLKPVRVFKRK